MSVGKFLTGLLIGSAVGSILAILFAPASGSDTRKKIKSESVNTYKKIENSLTDLYNKTDSAINDLQKTGEEVLSKFKETIGHSSTKDPRQEESIVHE